MNLRKIYHVLLNRFGSQGWWPTTPAGSLRPVYHGFPKVGGLTEHEKFEICLGAILTQNTAWTNVEKALFQLTKIRAVSPEKICKMPMGTLSKWIRSSGYFRQKAKKIKLFSKYLLENYGGRPGNLLKKNLDQAREELLNLHGIGPETADSMLLYAGGAPIFVVDAYTRRIGNRLGLFISQDYEEVRKYFEARLVRSAAYLSKPWKRHFLAEARSAALFNEFHALLVCLGKDICRKNPLCHLCPLQNICKTGKKYGSQDISPFSKGELRGILIQEKHKK